jgi:hypothetical protein
MSLEIQQEKNSYEGYRIFEHLNLHCNQLIRSVSYSCLYRCSFRFGGKYYLILESAETACWGIERNSQIFNADFYLPLYLPLWLRLYRQVVLASRRRSRNSNLVRRKVFLLRDVCTREKLKPEEESSINMPC